MYSSAKKQKVIFLKKDDCLSSKDLRKIKRAKKVVIFEINGNGTEPLFFEDLFAGTRGRTPFVCFDKNVDASTQINEDVKCDVLALSFNDEQEDLTSNQTGLSGKYVFSVTTNNQNVENLTKRLKNDFPSISFSNEPDSCATVQTVDGKNADKHLKFYGTVYFYDVADIESECIKLAKIIESEDDKNGCLSRFESVLLNFPIRNKGIYRDLFATIKNESAQNYSSSIGNILQSHDGACIRLAKSGNYKERAQKYIEDFLEI